MATNKNEITLFSGHKEGLPAHLQNLEMDEATKALIGRGGSGHRLSIRGSVFRMIVDGKEVMQHDERTLDLVIVAVAPHITREYYETAYVEGEGKGPTCYSDDGRAPRQDSPKLQNSICMTCKQNVKGSSPNGGKACGFSQRIAVVPASDIEGDIYQLKVPSMSLFGDNKDGKMPLQAYAKFLAEHKLPVTVVVTQARFDTNSSTPKLTFSAVRPLDVDEIKIVQARGLSDEAKRAISSTAAMLDGISSTAEVVKDSKEDTPYTAEVAKTPTKRPAKKETPAPTVMTDEDLAGVIDEWGTEKFDIE